MSSHKRGSGTSESQRVSITDLNHPHNIDPVKTIVFWRNYQLEVKHRGGTDPTLKGSSCNIVFRKGLVNKKEGRGERAQSLDVVADLLERRMRKWRSGNTNVCNEGYVENVPIKIKLETTNLLRLYFKNMKDPCNPFRRNFIDARNLSIVCYFKTPDPKPHTPRSPFGFSTRTVNHDTKDNSLTDWGFHRNLSNSYIRL